MTDWSISRLSSASIAPRKGHYTAVPQTPEEYAYRDTHPELFSFEAMSVGDKGGQAFLVPLDESSEATAELIIAAINAYAASVTEDPLARLSAVTSYLKDVAVPALCDKMLQAFHDSEEAKKRNERLRKTVSDVCDLLVTMDIETDTILALSQLRIEP